MPATETMRYSRIALTPFDPHARPPARDRPRQAEILPQRGPGILGVEDPAALQFGHHEAREILVGAGPVGRGHHEAIAGLALVPGLHLVGDVGRGAAEDRHLVDGAALAFL